MSDASLIDRLFDVIENDIVPKTAEGVARGNKLFGAAILRKSDLSVVVAETNNEMENPLWHGEVHALKRFYELPKADRPDPKDCIFLATHEPCSLCLSAITWTGFDNFYYLFSHEDSRDSFAIPHDLRILKEVFTPRSGRLRRRERLLEELFDQKGRTFASRGRTDAPRGPPRRDRPPLRRAVVGLPGEQGRQRHPAELMPLSVAPDQSRRRRSRACPAVRSR